MPRIRSLRARLLLTGCVVVAATVASATWSGTLFALLTDRVDDTLRASEELLEHAATIASALEREDDALVLALAGQVALSREQLLRERAAVDAAFRALEAAPRPENQPILVESLRDRIADYRTAGDQLLALTGSPDRQVFYQLTVNPALRAAVDDSRNLRETAYLNMQRTGLAARDTARRATGMVVVVAFGALILSAFAALYLSRTVLHPIRNLKASAVAFQQGDFARRVPIGPVDELGMLAEEFNRMADSLVAFQRTNLGEVMQARDLLAATLRALPDAVVVLRSDRTIESANPSARALLGLTNKSLPGPLDQLDLPDELIHAVHKALTATDTAAPAITTPLAIGEEPAGRFYQAVLAPLTRLEGEPRGLLLVLHDVTEFCRIDQLRADHIAVTSHELKTPLTTLRLNLLLLLEEADQITPRQREILDTAVQGCEALSAKVDRLLDLTRIEAGQLRLILENVDLQVILERALSPLRTAFADDGVAVSVATTQSDTMVRADPVRISVVISNLLSNALKYTRRGDSVTISLDRTETSEGDFVVLRVADTGIGVPVEFRERIFEKFFRVDHVRPALASPSPGVGIGLYICRQIVEAHGGAIRCLDNSGGPGVCFELQLRAAPTD